MCNSFDRKVSLEDEFYYVEKKYNDTDPNNPEIMLPEETRRSIIQMAKIGGLEDFYTQLNLLLNKNFKTPMPHVTLYTTSTREDKKLRGIGIYSQDQFEELPHHKV